MGIAYLDTHSGTRRKGEKVQYAVRCLAIIKNMPEEKLKAAEEMLMKMATADGSIDPREKQLLELYSL